MVQRDIEGGTFTRIEVHRLAERALVGLGNRLTGIHGIRISHRKRERQRHVVAIDGMESVILGRGETIEGKGLALCRSFTISFRTPQFKVFDMLCALFAEVLYREVFTIGTPRKQTWLTVEYHIADTYLCIDSTTAGSKILDINYYAHITQSVCKLNLGGKTIRLCFRGITIVDQQVFSHQRLIARGVIQFRATVTQLTSIGITSRGIGNCLPMVSA